MLRTTKRCLVWLLLLALMPGVGEALENAVHLVTNGHSAHEAEATDSHRPPSPEHDCNGIQHLCACCASLSFLPIDTLAPIPRAASESLIIQALTDIPIALISGVYHPPRP